MATEPDIDLHLAQLLERLGEVSRALRWKQATEADVSPLQLRILTFIVDHAGESVGVARLADELQVTRPTISDSVKVLAERKLLLRRSDKYDRRSHALRLTAAGRKRTAYTSPLDTAVAKLSVKQKEALLLSLMGLLETLFINGGVQVQRLCWTCVHYQGDRKKRHRCLLLKMDLPIKELRTDCPEHELKETIKA